MSRRRAIQRLTILLVALVAALFFTAGTASAEDGSIAHVESTTDGLRILVDVPAGVQTTLAGVRATLDGTDLDATAETTIDGSAIKRTTVLAIDTSSSMTQSGRFDAAKAAAKSYLDAVPKDVEVGIVTFNSTVDVALDPTTDRDAAKVVVDGLTLSQNTLLYDGLTAAVEAGGNSGQRTMLVLSDGADTGSKATLDDVAAAVKENGTRVHIVGLDLTARQLAPLRTIAAAGEGDVITSTGTALAEEFANQAEALADQVLVTAPLPDGFDAKVGTVVVTLPTAGEPVIARALATIESASTPEVPDALPNLATDESWNAPDWLLWAGLGVLALGLITVAVLLVPAAPAPMSIADRVTAYSTRTGAGEARDVTKTGADPVLDQAKAAAAGVLERNSALNERLTRRLSAAGSELKPSEWLLVHVGIVFVSGLFGLLVGKGNIILGLIFVVLGFFLPPMYLRFMAGRRRRAFESGLPDVLQLISGALSAGLSLAQACDTVVREGPEPIASEFKRVLVEARIGVTIEDAFDGVADRFASKDFAWAVMAIRIQRQVGGNLAELLTTVAATMRERQYLRRHVRALSAEGRMSAVILCALPPLFAIYLFAVNRDFLEIMYTDPRGIILSITAVLWLSLGMFWMSRMVKVVA